MHLQNEPLKYKLLFYKATKEFLGTLKLYKYGKLIKKWTARSGQDGFRSYWTNSKSPIPASDSIQGTYRVESGYVPGFPVAMGNWYYHILPDPILQKNGSGIRSEIGIHEDANLQTAPGTAGCIGIDPEHWQDCRKTLDAIFRQEGKGYDIPLQVVYGEISEILAKEQGIHPERAFEKALRFTLTWEGGFADHPNDYGGRTMKGITQNTYDYYRKSKGQGYRDVKLIADDELQDIYEKNYWQAAHCPAMIEPLAIVHFDTAVNFGVGGAGKFLQESLGFTGADVDGAIGRKTLAALAKNNTKQTAMRIIEGRIAYRNKRVKQDPTQQVFLKGWLNRDYALKRLIRDNY